MKAAGFRNKTDGKARSDWRILAEAVHDHFSAQESKELKAAIEYFDQSPPRRQDVEGGELTFNPVAPNTGHSTHDLLTYVRRVRNNLFHGGKFRGQYIRNPDRDLKLIAHSDVILAACLIASNILREAYENGDL